VVPWRNLWNLTRYYERIEPMLLTGTLWALSVRWKVASETHEALAEHADAPPAPPAHGSTVFVGTGPTNRSNRALSGVEIRQSRQDFASQTIRIA
jgi:hypothetical protein